MSSANKSNELALIVIQHVNVDVEVPRCHHFLCFVTIIQAKVISGHQI